MYPSNSASTFPSVFSPSKSVLAKDLEIHFKSLISKSQNMTGFVRTPRGLLGFASVKFLSVRWIRHLSSIQIFPVRGWASGIHEHLSLRLDVNHDICNFEYPSHSVPLSSQPNPELRDISSFVRIFRLGLPFKWSFPVSIDSDSLSMAGSLTSIMGVGVDCEGSGGLSVHIGSSGSWVDLYGSPKGRKHTLGSNLFQV